MNSFPTEILYFGVNRWDSMIQREQHLIAGLSRTFRLLFVDPPLSVPTVALGRSRGKNWNFKSRINPVNDRLLIYTPPAFPPFGQSHPWIHRFNSNLMISLTKKVIERLSFRNYILGTAWPFWVEVVKAFTSPLAYYDCSDEYPAFPGLRADRAMLRKAEEELLRLVDIVFCSSGGLKQEKARLNQNCFLIPNGVDLAPWNLPASEKRPLPEMDALRQPILGYMGTIGEWFDFHALAVLARARPDWSFVVIGPVASKDIASRLAGLPNTHWLGEKAYRDISAYLERFDLCLIPFKVDAFTKKIYPSKFHQYLAAGKPVVSSPLPDLEPFVPWVEFYTAPEEMEIKIEKCLNEDSPEKAAARRKIAGENTWDRRVESMMEIFHSHLTGRPA